MVSKKELLLVGLSALMICGVAVSAEIYQWRDAAGQVHFVDNPSKVPAEYRVDARRDLGELQATTSDGAVSLSRSEGKLKWESSCAACHVTSQGDKGEKTSLFNVLIDDATKYPVSRAQLVREFRRASDGHYSDMPAVSISDDELALIAEYLLSMQN